MIVCSNMRCENNDCENHYSKILTPGRYEFVDMKRSCSKPKKKSDAPEAPEKD